jgi:D-galacturonate reductase
MASKLGDFQFFQSFMSQPKFQLETFKFWAGVSSDISYYLNSHHIDVHCWAMQGKAQPVRVVASGATGIASSPMFGCPEGTEDTITLLTDWRNVESGNSGTAVYTASWGAPKADVHSQQRFHYLGSKGEITEDQAHRG